MDEQEYKEVWIECKADYYLEQSKTDEINGVEPQLESTRQCFRLNDVVDFNESTKKDRCTTITTPELRLTIDIPFDKFYSIMEEFKGIKIRSFDVYGNERK